MLELIEEASKVLRTPPPEPTLITQKKTKTIVENMAEAMEKYGGLMIHNQVGLPYKML